MKGFFPAILIGLLVVEPVQGQTYDALSNWNSTSNSGVWQYGTSTALGGAFTPFTLHNSQSSAPTYTWWSWNGTFVGPVTALNTSGATITLHGPGDPFPIVWPIDRLLIAPGGSANSSPVYNVLRWKAPAGEAIDLIGSIEDLQNASVTWYVLEDGVQKLSGGFPGGGGLQGSQPFSLNDLQVLQGDTLDFVVYSGGFEGDDVLGLQETIGPSVPEPSVAILLWLVGLGLLGGGRARRSARV
ncbi:MAG TPA: hypothetical protein VFW23_04560 [Tepidisphaeraceae bacterium]|nr:hypothetical protein [Tepidisphaeraceae bacterium]